MSEKKSDAVCELCGAQGSPALIEKMLEMRSLGFDRLLQAQVSSLQNRNAVLRGLIKAQNELIDNLYKEIEELCLE